MVIDTKQESLELIESALNEIYDEAVSTSILLLKCQRVDTLLESKEENEWIWKELEGYDMDEDVPQYRCVGYDLEKKKWTSPIGKPDLKIVAKLVSDAYSPIARLAEEYLDKAQSSRRW